jgi:hypothetical protein
VLNKVRIISNYNNKRAGNLRCADKGFVIMSFLDTGPDQSHLLPAVLRHSIRRDPGCSQCGRTLEMNGDGKFDPSGKCLNCANPVFEGDDGFDELAD